MHVLNHEPSNYVASQTSLGCWVRNEWYATSNAKKVVFCFYRLKVRKSQILMPAENDFMQRNRNLSKQYLK